MALARRTLTLVAVLCAGAAAAADPVVPDFRIQSIELSTFDPSTGAIAPLPTDGFNLFRDLLVKVKVVGPNGAYAKGRQLSIELADSKHPAQKRDVSIGEDGATFVLAYFPTGLICGTLTVRVRLLGQKTPGLKEVKQAGFACGE